MQTYYQNNKEKCKAASKKWVYDHYDKVLSDSKDYYLKHTGERIAYAYRRAALLPEVYFGMSARQSAVYGIKNVIAVYQRSKGLCEQCGASKKKICHHLHHLDEAGRGTWKAINKQKVNNDPSNMLLLCPSCHKQTHKEIRERHVKEVFLNHR